MPIHDVTSALLPMRPSQRALRGSTCTAAHSRGVAVVMLGLGAVLSTFVVLTQPARASCGYFLPDSIEILPSNGAVAPSDIQAVFAWWDGFALTLTLEADGKSYPFEGRLARLPEGLQPGDVFEYTIVATLDEPDQGPRSKTFGPFSFVVGDEPAHEVPMPDGTLHYVGGGASSCAPEKTTPSCKSDRPGEDRLFPIPRYLEANCYDNGVTSYYVVELAQSASYPIVEITGSGSNFYSLGCSRFMYVPACDESPCVEAVPFDQAMRRHPERASTICQARVTQLDDEPAQGVEDEKDGGEADAAVLHDLSDAADASQPATTPESGPSEQSKWTTAVAGCAVGTSCARPAHAVLLLCLALLLLGRCSRRSR